jgi:sirohydrochlorin ferrochelatase
MTTRNRRKPTIKTGLLLVGHGSRVPDATKILSSVASALHQRFRSFAVEICFLTITRPDFQTGIDNCVARGAARVLLVPYFLYLGGQVGRDLPEQMGEARRRYPDLEIRIAPHIGYDPRVVAVTADRVRQGLRAGRWT